MSCAETDINMHGQICGARLFSGQTCENKTGTNVECLEEEINECHELQTVKTVSYSLKKENLARKV